MSAVETTAAVKVTMDGGKLILAGSGFSPGENVRLSVPVGQPEGDISLGTTPINAFGAFMRALDIAELPVPAATGTEPKVYSIKAVSGPLVATAPLIVPPAAPAPHVVTPPAPPPTPQEPPSAAPPSVSNGRPTTGAQVTPTRPTPPLELQVAKQQRGIAVVNELLLEDITVTNPYDAPAYDLTVELLLPGNIQFKSSLPPPLGQQGVAITSPIRWASPRLDGRASLKIEVALVPGNLSPGPVTVRASAKWVGEGTARQTITALGAGLTVHLWDSVDPANVGGTIVYTLSLKAQGEAPPSVTKLVVTFPQKLRVARTDIKRLSGPEIRVDQIKIGVMTTDPKATTPFNAMPFYEVEFPPFSFQKRGEELVMQITASAEADGDHVVRATVHRGQFVPPVVVEEGTKVFP